MRPTDLMSAINIYFDNIYYYDAALLDRVFHQASSLFDVDNGSLTVEPIASFRHDVDNRPSPASKNQTREEEIIMIDRLSKDCALVKLRLRAHQNVFIDHLSFVKDKNGWCIVAKVWHLERMID